MISIIMATYNRANLINETLISIQNQTFENWECIIIDDGSTDNTYETIKPILDLDNRFKYILRENVYYKGLSGCRNFGLDLIKKSTSKFVCFFDDDDIMHPKKLELQVLPMLNDEKVSMTTCQYKHLYKTEDLDFELTSYDCPISSKNLFNDFFNGKIWINSLGPLWRKEVLSNYRFDNFLPYTEERDLYLKIFLKENINYIPINYVLFYYRKHELSNTANRYSQSVFKASVYKSDLNLYEFVKTNNLMNDFLYNEFLKKFILTYNEPLLVKELINDWKIKNNNRKFILLLFSVILKFKYFFNKCFLIINKNL